MTVDLPKDFASHMSNAFIHPDAVERLRAPFASLADALLKASAGRDVYFMRNDGNFGDALIHRGTEVFLEDVGIRYTLLDMASRGAKIRGMLRGAADHLRSRDRRALFIYSGGGGWADVCDVALKNVRRQFAITRDMFVLPSTIERTLPDPSLPLFVRDLYQSHRNLPAAPFCHDMAFYLALVDPDRLLADRKPPTKRLGLVFRTDNEARISSAVRHPDNVDISALGTTGSPIEEFLRHLDQYEHVVTDRLHAAIGAALLGKRVSIVTGSYFKIEAIYRSSIENIFRNCTLVSDEEAAALMEQMHD